MGNDTHSARPAPAGIERKLVAILGADVQGFSRLMGEDEEAIATAKKILARQPNFPPAYFLLAYSCAQLDRLEEARAAGTEFQRLVPSASLEQWKQMAAFKDPALLERDLAALRTRRGGRSNSDQRSVLSSNEALDHGAIRYTFGK